MIRPGFRASICALSLLLAAGCGDGKASADKSSDFTGAADALAAKLEGGTVPPASDPAFTAFEAQTSSGLTKLGTPELPLDGFDSYEKLCGKAATIVGGYINAGVDQAPDKAAAMNANAERYLDQLFTPLLFSAHCTAAHMPFLEEKVGEGDLGDKKAAVEQVRSGAYGQASGLLQMAGAGDLDPARKGRIMDLLAGDAANFAIAFNAERRSSLNAMIDALPPEQKAKGEAIKAAFAKAPCGKLCSM